MHLLNVSQIQFTLMQPNLFCILVKCNSKTLPYFCWRNTTLKALVTNWKKYWNDFIILFNIDRKMQSANIGAIFPEKTIANPSSCWEDLLRISIYLCCCFKILNIFYLLIQAEGILNQCIYSCGHCLVSLAVDSFPCEDITVLWWSFTFLLNYN